MPTRLRQVSGSGFDPTRRNGDHTLKVSIRTLLVDCTKERLRNNPSLDGSQGFCRSDTSKRTG